MSNSCFAILIRERACQNGVPLTTDRVFSSINEAENISLSFGYSLTLTTFGADDILVTFTNLALNISLRFSISNPGVGVFDLPIDGGTFRVVIISQEVCCDTSSVCNCSCCNNNNKSGNWF